MKRRFLILAGLMLALTGGCNSSDASNNSGTSDVEFKTQVIQHEVGTELELSATDILTLDDTQASKAAVDTSNVNPDKTGEYKAHVFYKGEKYEFTVKVNDTTAPLVETMTNRVISTNKISAIDLTSLGYTVAEPSEYTVTIAGYEKIAALEAATETYLDELSQKSANEEATIEGTTAAIPTEEGIFRVVLSFTDEHKNEALETIFIVYDSDVEPTPIDPVTPTPTPTAAPTQEPTDTPTPTPTQKPTDTPTPTPTQEPEKPTYTYTNKNATMYTISSINVRDLPSTDGKKLGGLAKDAEVKVTGVCNETGWYRITYNGKVGYVSNQYLTTTKPEVPTPTPTQKPTDTPTPTPTQKPTDTPTPTPTQKPTDTPTPTPTQEPEKPTYTYTNKNETIYTTGSINVRDLPSKNGKKLGELSKDAEVKVTGVCNETGWYRITYNGKVGYVSNQYLTTTKPEVPTPTPTPTQKPTVVPTTPPTPTTPTPTPEETLTSYEQALMNAGYYKVIKLSGCPYGDIGVLAKSLNDGASNGIQAIESYLKANKLLTVSMKTEQIKDGYVAMYVTTKIDESIVS